MEERNPIFEEFRTLVQDILSKEEIEKMQPFFEKLHEKGYQTFTELQCAALSSPDFWDETKNKIVLGSTSSGKTLVAEINMVYQIFCKSKKAIYLVPLKVLTTEKQAQFEQDFEGKRVYISSSDYQEQDYELSWGKYDIGILVYEKFFAMLAENSEGFLRNCNLVVVDEMHMLTDPERGPKLEFSIEKIRRNHSSISILGMTTSECDVSRVLTWLDMQIIQSTSRPKEIEERFLYCDSYMEKAELRCFVNGEKKEAPDFLVNAGNSGDLQKFQLCQVLQQHPKDNIIIYCNSKKKCEDLVDYLCSCRVLAPDPAQFSDFPNITDTDFEEVQYQKYRDHLERYRIAYHNAGLTQEVREYIEEQFREQNIRIIVATDTLTMGINTPTEVMVLYDYEVFRGGSLSIMPYQNYKNAIGRAGRLGSTGKNGISYVLMGKNKTMMESLIRQYVEKPDHLAVTTAVSEPKDDKETTLSMVLAPFYLNLLNQKAFYTKEIAELLKKGLGDYHDSAEQLSAEIIQIWLGKHPSKPNTKLPVLVQKSDFVDEFDDDETDCYDIKSFGKALSPYALDVRTYTGIYKKYADPNFQSSRILPVFDAEHPFSLDPEKAQDEQPMYFLDVMYEVCKSKAILKQKNFLTYPSSSSQSVQKYMQQAIEGFFRKHVKENMLCKNSNLRGFCSPEPKEITETNGTPLYRTIVLYYWVQGYDVRDIRRELGLPNSDEYYIYTADVGRLGELCAYQLEAIAKVAEASPQKNIEQNEKLQRMFYILSIRVKYGMNHDLAKIANKHIHGLNRQRLLKLEHAYRKKADRYDSITDFMLSRQNENEIRGLDITEAALSELKKILDNIMKHEAEQLEYDFIRSGGSGDLLNLCKKIKSMEYEENAAFESLKKLFAEYFSFRIYPDKKAKPCYVDAAEDQKPEIRFILCLNHSHYSSGEEIRNSMKELINLPADGCPKPLYIYKNGELSEKNMDCMTSMEFYRMLLGCINKNNSDNCRGAGKELMRQLRARMRLDAVPPALPEQEHLPALPSENPQNVTNNYTVIVQGDQINLNQFNQFNQITVNMLQVWNTKLDALRGTENKNDELAEEERVAAFFKEAEDVIEVPVIPSLDEQCRSIMQNDPDYNALLSFIQDDEELTQTVQQAIYIKHMLSSEANIKDYSPAAVLYGKSLEHCLFSRLTPLLQKKIPDSTLSKNPNDLVKAPKSDWTLGIFQNIVKKEFTVSSPPLPQYQLCLDMTNDQIEYWQKMRSLLEKCTTIRNQASHRGNTIPIGEIDKLHQYASKLMQMSSELQAQSDLLPDPS